LHLDFFFLEQTSAAAEVHHVCILVVIFVRVFTRNMLV